MRVVPLAAALLALGLSLPPNAAAVSMLEPVPVGHWAYEALWQLATAGLISFQDLAQQPLAREEVARLVSTADQAASTRPMAQGLADVLKALKQAFPPQLPGYQIVWDSRLHSGTGAGPSLAPYPRFEIPLFATPLFERGSAATRIGSGYIQVGSEAQRWGGSPRSSLLLSGHAGALEQIRFSFELPNIRTTTFAGILSTERYLVGTKVDWMVSEQLRIGVAELAVTTPGQIATWILNPLPALLTNPLNIVQVEQALQATSNIALAADFDLLVRPGVSLYGQLMADDIVFDAPDFPPRIGAQIGLYLNDPFGTGRTSLRLEYSGVSNWTYTDMTPAPKDYTFNGRSLGYWLGNDADDLYLELSHVVHPAVAISVWLARSRHGEGRIGQNWTSRDQAWQNWWLSGVVETRYALGARYEHRAEESWSRYWIEVGYVVNRDNAAGANSPDIRLGIELSSQW